MSDPTTIVVREPPASIQGTFQAPRIKPAPQTKAVRVPFEYRASDDGTDENLLILLHGLGDTHQPFAKLGKQLNLPQTATLALRAPEQIPYLYEQAYQWYISFDPLGEVLDRPDPTPAIDILTDLCQHLTRDCQWPADKIHLFGFAQGGSVASEFALAWWKKEVDKERKSKVSTMDPGGGGGKRTSSSSANDDGGEYIAKSLGSITSISGPLLSYPTHKPLCPTPILVTHRPPPSQSALPSDALTAFKKGFSHVTEVNLPKGEGMPRSKEEWTHVMKFWSERLGRRQVDGLYEVMTGMGSR